MDKCGSGRVTTPSGSATEMQRQHSDIIAEGAMTASTMINLADSIISGIILIKDCPEMRDQAREVARNLLGAAIANLSIGMPIE